MKPVTPPSSTSSQDNFNVKDLTAEELLRFKDTLSIPDHKWGYVCETFHLGEGQTLHYVREARTVANAKLNIQKVNKI